MLLVIFLTLTTWTVEASLFILVATAVGLANTFMAPVFAFATATLATVIPSAPGFVGTFDYFGTLGAVAYGIDWNRAAAFIVLVHLLLLTPACLISVAYLLGKGQMPDLKATESAGRPAK